MTINNNPPLPQESIALKNWEAKRGEATRDLVIKKIAVSLIAIINFAALGAAFYYICQYSPIPSQAFLISPFIVGVLAALANLKFPTLGIAPDNYTSFLSPVSLVGRGLAYLFFGPLMYSTRHSDWTPYHNPIWANKISEDLESLPFDKIAEGYGKHIHNLSKYGFLQPECAKTLQELFAKYESAKEASDFWKGVGLKEHAQSKKAKESIEELNRKWDEAKRAHNFTFPHPKLPELDFSKIATKAELQLFSLCCNNTPFDLAQNVKI
jgi:hypothetical protein